MLISTALSCPRKITFISILKFCYARTFGILIEITKIYQILNKLFKRNFTAGGRNSKIYTEWFPEKKIGITTVLFPKGFDIRLNHFPNPEFKNIFDIFLCHGLLDNGLVKKKFKNSKSIIIGYPRYDNLENIEATKKKIYSEFNMPENKKLIFWCPTHIEEKGETFKNINLWIKIVSILTKSYNVLIRPHPKTLAIDGSLVRELINSGFFVDEKSNRKIGNLYKVSDLVLADYGGSVLSTVYLEKPLVLLNLPDEFNFVKKLLPTGSLDIKVREEILSFDNSKVQNNIFKNQIDKIIYENKTDHIKKIKTHYFGSYSNVLPIKNLAQKLENLLPN